MRKKLIALSILLYTGMLAGCGNRTNNIPQNNEPTGIIDSIDIEDDLDKDDSNDAADNTPEQQELADAPSEEQELEDDPLEEQELADDPSEEQELADDPHSVQAQIQIIADNIDVWAIEMVFANEQYHYSVTDLDNNGRLEVIASNIGGTGIYTYSSFYEINEHFDGLIKCEYDSIEGARKQILP